MSPNDDSDDDPDATELDALTRNRYFFGKLMTPRDMRTEQAYHVGRSTTHVRFVTGVGIVHGLGIKGGEEDDGRLCVTIEPGLAVDPDGYQIVVDREATKPVRNADETDPDAAFGLPDDDNVLLYLARAEIKEEPVPVPGAESVPEGTEEYNRVRESFELRYQETDTGVDGDDALRKGVPAVDFPRVPDLSPLDSDEMQRAYATELYRIADSYVRERGHAPPDGKLVLLGALQRTGDQKWGPVTDLMQLDPLSYVYSNDMLYAAVSRLALHVDPIERHLFRSVVRNTRIALERIEELPHSLDDSDDSDGSRVDSVDEKWKEELENPSDGLQWFIDLVDEIRYLELADELSSHFDDDDEDFVRFKNAAADLDAVSDEGRNLPVEYQLEHALHLATLLDRVNETTRWLDED